MLSHFQFLGLIGSMDVNFPIQFEASMSWVDSFSLNMEALEKMNFPKLDVRWQFMAYACLFPLGLTLIMLLFFNPASVVAWYFSFLFSIAMLGAAFALIMMPRDSDKYFGNTPFPAEMILYCGM